MSLPTQGTTQDYTMSRQERHHRRHEKHKGYRSGGHRSYEDSDIPSSSSQPIPDNYVGYGGICPSCKIPYDDLERHYQICHMRLTRADIDSTMESARPQYGKDMHPDNPNFSEENTTTSTSFDSRRIPLKRAEDEGGVSPSASDSVTSSYATQVPDSPPLAVSNARAWDQTRGVRQHQDHLRPAAPLSEASSSSSGLPVPQYSERVFERLQSRGTLHPVGDQYGNISTSQTAQNQSTNDSSGYPQSSTSYGNASTASSISYSYISPGSLTYMPRERVPPPSLVPPGPQDERGREQRRPEYYSSAPSSSRRSEEYHGHRDRDSRESYDPRRHPPRTTGGRQRRDGRRNERSRSRGSHYSEDRPPAPRNERYDDTMTSEDFVPRDGGRHTGASRTPYAQPRREHFRENERVVLPGDRSQFSRSYLQDMGRIRLGEAGGYDTREDEGRYADEEYDSDDHQFTTADLEDMARVRYWRSDQRF